ncbi:hypothetical protein K2X85_16695 [bacterium]|jgi:hypothetical protein|nr:hypothetical protein [bacterium]
MDRELIYLSLITLGLSSGLFLVGCKTADEGPRPFVMPARPVINMPASSHSHQIPDELIPSNSTEPSNSKSANPRLPMARKPVVKELGRQTN